MTIRQMKKFIQNYCKSCNLCKNCALASADAPDTDGCYQNVSDDEIILNYNYIKMKGNSND